MLNKICTDLETSKKLKELGIEMKTEFYWIFEPDENDKMVPDLYWNDLNVVGDGSVFKAYTLEQILEMFIYKGTIDIYRGKNGYFGINFNNEISYYRQDGDNMTTTAAKLLIRLVEGKTIKIGE